MPAHEQRCVICGAPMVDHTPLRYVVRAWWRHRAVLCAGWILGHLPLTTEDVQF